MITGDKAGKRGVPQWLWNPEHKSSEVQKWVSVVPLKGMISFKKSPYARGMGLMPILHRNPRHFGHTLDRRWWSGARLCDAVSVLGAAVELEAGLGRWWRSGRCQAVGLLHVPILYVLLDSDSKDLTSLRGQSQRNLTVAHNVLKKQFTADTDFSVTTSWCDCLLAHA